MIRGPSPVEAFVTEVVCLVEAEVGRPVPLGFRSVALRSDQYVLRRRDGAEPESQARLQPG